MTIRSARSSMLVSAVMLFATVAHAQQNYTLVGKFASSRGVGINIPLFGNNPGGQPNCGATSPRTSTNMTMTMVKTAGMVPGATPIVQGFRFGAPVVPQKMTPPKTAGAMWTNGGAAAPWATMFANNEGCISGFAPRAAVVDMATAGALMQTHNRAAVPGIVATMAGVGAAFNFPAYAFSFPWPDVARANQIPLLGMTVIQLGTSFRVSAPQNMLPTIGPDQPGGTMNNGTNTAPLRFFQKSAWQGGPGMTLKGQTGRAGANFTWCPMATACNYVTQAGTLGGNSAPMIVKYTAGPNRFGGTMSYVIRTGPNPSSLAIAFVGAGGPLQFLGLAGMGSQPTGRGYADYLTDPLMGGPNWPMFMVGSVLVPQIMAFRQLATMVSGVSVPATMPTVDNNLNYGFALTTGTVLLRNTGMKLQGGATVATLTGMGKDTVTAMGKRNISLVAGSVSAVPVLKSKTGNMVQIALPEPGSPLQLLAGAAALLGIAVWRSRRQRF